MKLSPIQQELLAYMGDQSLVRLEGGFWVRPDQEMHAVNIGPDRTEVIWPTRSFGTNTVYSLVRKGVLVVTAEGPPLGITEVRRADAEQTT